ncbi:MAG: aminoacyl-tRNA hydrolase [Opitutales bacterium]|nr:aminoacyl-tRNA hydrolase [Opitutales bacterium]
MPVSLVVGLGNPGREYAETRHNVGFRTVSAWASKLGVAFSADTARKGEFAKTVFAGSPLWLAKPTTYMNNSGECVSAFARYRKIDFSEVAVIYDDITLPPGTLKISLGGGDGGHNGIKSLIRHCGTAFMRIRIGIGPKIHREQDLADFVLGKLTAEEQTLFASQTEHYIYGIELLVSRGLVVAQNTLNKHIKP